MKILILQPAGENLASIIKQTKELLQKNCPKITVEVRDSGKSKLTCEDIRKAEADLFVNFNLAGFEQSTLTDGLAYNLLDCKQIHILLEQKLPNEKYLEKQLSISMFFYCLGREYYQYLSDRYPDIPWLREISSQGGENKDSSGMNANILCGIIQEVARICRIATS